MKKVTMVCISNTSPQCSFQSKMLHGFQTRNQSYRVAFRGTQFWSALHRRNYPVDAVHFGVRGSWQKKLVSYHGFCLHRIICSCNVTQVECEEVENRCHNTEDIPSTSSTVQSEDYSKSNGDGTVTNKDGEEIWMVYCKQKTKHCRGLAKAASYAYNDAKFVNERARNDLILLSREITRLNDRARQDFELIGSEFLKLDARAREDTGKLDNGVKRKAARLQRIAEGLTDKAQVKLKSAAAQHWSDGALEADLKRADLKAKRRAMEDAFMALEFVKNIHDMMVKSVNRISQSPESKIKKEMVEGLMVENEGKARKIYPGKISDDQIAAVKSVYWDMASAFSEVDGIDFTNPEELELLVATLLDIDAIDGKRSVSLLVECSNSPDVGTRQALANALGDAPSMWTLGNVGMGALQRLSQDENPAVATAASKAIKELQKQWKVEEGDRLVFSMDEILEGMGNLDLRVDTNEDEEMSEEE